MRNSSEKVIYPNQANDTEGIKIEKDQEVTFCRRTSTGTTRVLAVLNQREMDAPPQALKSKRMHEHVHFPESQESHVAIEELVPRSAGL